MAITFDAVSSTSIGATTSISVSHTAANAAGSIALVAVCWRGNTTGPNVSVTYGGTTATLVNFANLSVASASIFSFPNPPNAAATVTANVTTAVLSMGITVATYTGASTLVANTSIATSAASSIQGTTIINGTTNSWCFAAGSALSTVTKAITSSATQRSQFITNEGTSAHQMFSGDQASSQANIIWTGGAGNSGAWVGIAISTLAIDAVAIPFQSFIMGYDRCYHDKWPMIFSNSLYRPANQGVTI